MKKWITFLLLSGMLQLVASDLSGFKDLTDLSSAQPTQCFRTVLFAE